MQFPSSYFLLIYSLPQLIWNERNIYKTIEHSKFLLKGHLADVDSCFLKMEIMMEKDFMKMLKYRLFYTQQ